MKYLFALAAVLLLISCNDKKNTLQDGITTDTVVIQRPGLLAGANLAALPPPFNTLDFDRAVAYDYGKGYDELLIIDENGKPDKSVIKQKELTAKEAEGFLTVLGTPSTYGNSVYNCFIPRMGLVLYKGDAVVFHTSICFACNYLHSSMAIPAMVRPHTDAITGKEVFGEGFSDEGKAALQQFCAAFKFSHCIGNPVNNH
ncbi:MAG: hypothetical protein V4581_11280 [Bacteroidota bacterium]